MRWIFLFALIPLSTSVQAHHSRAPFLLDETFQVEGTVVETAWRSPHIYMVVDVPEDSGGRRRQELRLLGRP